MNDEEKENEEIRREILIEEYRELNESIRNRGRQFAMVQSILISGSLLAVAFALRFLRDLDSPIVGCTLIIAILLVVFAWLMDFTTTRLDKIFFDRVHQIENDPLIKMEVGHHKLYEDKIKCSWWYFLRRLTWPAIFLTLLVSYITILVFFI
jgi:hypothetical protein